MDVPVVAVWGKNLLLYFVKTIKKKTDSFLKTLVSVTHCSFIYWKTLAFL